MPLIQRQTELPTANRLPVHTCLLLNVSQCDVSENFENFIITVYNPLSRNVTMPVRIPVTGESYIVLDPKGKKVLADMVPIPEPVLKIPGRRSLATKELVFLAENLPPLGYHAYVIFKSNHIDRPKNPRSSVPKDIVMGPRVSILILQDSVVVGIRTKFCVGIINILIF